MVGRSRQLEQEAVGQVASTVRNQRAAGKQPDKTIKQVRLAPPPNISSVKGPRSRLHPMKNSLSSKTAPLAEVQAVKHRSCGRHFTFKL